MKDWLRTDRLIALVLYLIAGAVIGFALGVAFATPPAG